jgi:hypothetical protein
MPTAMPPSAFQQPPSRFPDAGDYLRNQLNLPPGTNVSLWSLPDPEGGEKPTIPLPMLVKLAIYGSPKRRLTLQEIYAELSNRFQWFREHQHEQAWKVGPDSHVLCLFTHARHCRPEFNPSQLISQQGL